MTDQEKIKWIDNASYEDLLRKNRFESGGSAWFVGEVGKHFLKTMRERKRKVGAAAHTAASKSIGW